MNNEIESYIYTGLKEGKKVKLLTNELRGTGWDERTIQASLKKVQNTFVPRVAAFASPYLPTGGLQIYAIVIGLLSPYARVRFHAVQGTIYWIMWLLLCVPLVFLYQFTSSNWFLVCFFIYIFGGGIMVPTYLGVLHKKGLTVKLPLVWQFSAAITRYQPDKTAG